MCTVTYVPRRDSILLTSNRDEQLLRSSAAMPERYQRISGNILMPKDGQAGGTWIAIHNNGNAMVLLNGAFKKHVPNPPYRKSRGLIFLDIFDGNSPRNIFDNIDLKDIEPFTLVVWERGELFEARWDGVEKYMTPLPASEPRIWSSVTLYDASVMAMRKSLFEQWLKETRYKTAEEIRLFHEFAHNDDVSVRLGGDGILQTVSITGIEIMNRKAVMHYKDMQAGLVSVNEWYIPTLMQNS